MIQEPCSWRIRQGIKQQLLLGSERTVSEALQQTLELEIANLVFGSSDRLWKTSDWTLWRSLSPPKGKQKWQYVYGLPRTSSLKEGEM
jgi:hypothetical protein